MQINGVKTGGTDALGDDELVRLEARLREEFYEVERRETPSAGTRPPSLHESPALLKAFDRWNRVSSAARRRGLGVEDGMR